MKHDDAETYFLQFTTDLPNECGGRHMALFLEWALLRGLASDALMAHAAGLRRGEVQMLDLLFSHCDGKLTDEDFSDEGNAFMESFYARDYLPAYIRITGATPDASADEIFARAPSAPQRDRLLWLLDRRYSDWLRRFGVLPRQILLDRCVARLAPVIERGGFPRAEPTLTGSHLVCASFARDTRGGRLVVDLIAEDSPEWFYGLQVRLTAYNDTLRARIYAEKQTDLGSVTQIQPAATIPLARLAEGWDGPLQLHEVLRQGFWVFWERDIDPLLDWLGPRLSQFALPVLRGLDDVDGVALAYGSSPVTASPIHDALDPYPAILALEQARHPRLAALLDQIEDGILALEPRARSRHQRGALQLVARVRDRQRLRRG